MRKTSIRRGQRGVDVPQTRRSGGGGRQGGRHLVFVYGTLKRGFSNHFFLGRACFVGCGQTVERFALYVDEYPGVYPGEPVSRVQGEVYAVNEAMLARLDALEDHPTLYRREEVEVALDDGLVVKAWIYFYPHRGGRLVEGGEFRP
ncbi:gamma-glutamylcyclotransferase [Pseudodesulfovibrio sp. F-1]|uniref:Gamma-glutamylcyclotransferase family protein n=1 Tax=Pseudodesulfovibrio alkaliphilus TaxID=2661613 RepID=A0A7K1KK22_9BACT|nr:gamma-glutamylcyclotransferase family protein [Pseudodesulfovibrio alkaliphilus]MUM76341.1 gamma-glutamylcyclotransferase [Pseudodesulfovibrio alkaliphilus]